MKHYSVLSKEVKQRLNIKPNGIYIDATLGLGGHTKMIAETDPSVKVYSFDQDPNAIAEAKKRLEGIDNVEIIYANFKDIKEELNKRGVDKVDGILYDLGTSYYQLTDEDRGFTYHGNSKLDMRMDPNGELSAIEVVNEYSEEELANIFWMYGDERQSRKLAKAIVEARENEKIVMNTQLNEIIRSVKGFNKDKHPSKNIYQAIRIEVNDELGVIRKSVKDSLDLIKKGGVVAVISFHSLEDKVVKDIFWKAKSDIDETPMGNIHKFKTSKTIYPTAEEIEENNASRSSKLRLITKLID